MINYTNNSYICLCPGSLNQVLIFRYWLINKTDKYILSDYPIALDEQMKIKLYRQDLREFINNNEIKILAGDKVDFPTQPDFINLNIIY